MIKRFIAAALIAMSSTAGLYAVDFVSTDKPDKLFNLGVRLGVNTSNLTVKNNVFNNWNVNSWGTGFDAGVVADINFVEFFSVQPGFFYESRSGSFAYRYLTPNDNDNEVAYTWLGKGRTYNFTVPIIANFHFNILDELRWNVEVGPYLQFKLKSTFDNKFAYPEFGYDGLYFGTDPKTSKFDFGFKMGTSIDICEHYYIGVHYLAGVLKAWNVSYLGGHNKAWTFTIGYNF